MLWKDTHYSRHELEMFIGSDNLKDFDVDAIESEVSRWDSDTNCLVWTVEGEGLSRACMRHQKDAKVGLREYNRADLIDYLDWLYWENCEDHFDIDAIERVATIVVDGRRYWSLTDEQLETVFELFHDVTREVTTAQVMHMLTTGELSDLGSGYVPLRGDSLVVGKVWNSVQRRYTYWIERDYFGMTEDENREIDALVLKGYKLWFVS